MTGGRAQQPSQHEGVAVGCLHHLGIERDKGTAAQGGGAPSTRSIRKPFERKSALNVANVNRRVCVRSRMPLLA
jgi:hypothetical protein